MSGRLLREYPRHAIALSLAAGLALAPASEWIVIAGAGLLALTLLAHQTPAHVAVAAAALLVAGAGLGSARLAAIDADPLARAPTGVIELRGYLVSQARVRADGLTLRIRERSTGQLVEVRSFASPPSAASPYSAAPPLSAALAQSLHIGDEIAVSGRLSAVSEERATSPTAKSYASYLLRSGVRRQLRAKTIAATGQRRGGARGVIDAIRTRSELALALGLPREPAGLLRGMVLGGDAGLAEQTSEDFRVAGLSHILAVSGQNVLLIVILVRAMLIAVGANRRAQLAVPAAVIVIYILLCGAQASVIRAGAMGLAGLAMLAASRRSSRVYALILAAIVVLAWNPRATADIGAQLSFAAVLGIMAFAQPIARAARRMPESAAQAFGATAGATLATAPLMAYHFQAISLVSLAANVLGEPLIGPIVWLGSLTAAIGQFSPEIGALLNAPNGFLLAALIELARGAARIPGAQLTLGDFGVWPLLIGLACVCAAAAVANGWTAPRLVPHLRASPAAVVGAMVVFAAVAVWPPGPSGRPAAPAITMLDVGQGDAMLLSGKNCHVLIDAGKAGRGLGRLLRDRGARKLDALLVTHAEDDHFGGALELAQQERLKVGVFIDGGGATQKSDFAELRGLIRESGARTVPGIAGLRWACPGIEIEVIAPPPAPPDAPPPERPNARSVVTLIRVGAITMFASGDAEGPDLAGLSLPSVNVIKVPHHGSADPGAAQLLQTLQPRVAVVGVGSENRYGHPTPQTLSELERAGVRTYRTDRDGTVVIEPAAGGTLRVARER